MKRLIAMTVAAILAASAVSCAATASPSASSSDTAQYESYLAERGKMPDSLIIGTDSDAKQYGVDLAAFADDGFFTRADNGNVVMLAKSDKGIDRAVRDFAKYGNSDDYFKTYNEGHRVKSLTVCGNDIADYAIVREAGKGDDSDWNRDQSAADLAEYIEKTCGARLPVYTEEEYAALSPKPAHTVKLALDYHALGDEGFTIDITEAGDVTIRGGRYRGLVYGVFDLLRDIGWRFFADVLNTPEAPTVEYLYESDRVDLTPSLSRTETPSLPVRGYWDDYVYATDANGISERNFMNGICKCKYGVVGDATHGIQTSHCLENAGLYVHTTEQPCYTDPEILDCICEYALSDVRERIAAGEVVGRELLSVNVGEYDCQSFCECKNCRDVYREDGSHAGSVLRMTNTVADVLDENYPGVAASMIAYTGSNPPPKKTVPRANTHVWYAYYLDHTLFACNAHCISGRDCDSPSCANTVFSREIEGWRRICTDDNLYCYYYPFSAYDATAYQFPFVLKVWDDLDYLINELHIRGVTLFNSEPCGTALNALVVQLSSMMCWDSSLTREEYKDAAREWFNIIYGEGGDILYEYFLENERAGEGKGCWCSFQSRIADAVDEEYMDSHFDKWCDMFAEAEALADTSHQAQMVRQYKSGMLLACIGMTFERRYENGTKESRRIMEERYRELYDIYKTVKINLFFGAYKAPEELDVTVNPFVGWW